MWDLVDVVVLNILECFVFFRKYLKNAYYLLFLIQIFRIMEEAETYDRKNAFFLKDDSLCFQESPVLLLCG